MDTNKSVARITKKKLLITAGLPWLFITIPFGVCAGFLALAIYGFNVNSNKTINLEDKFIIAFASIIFGLGGLILLGLTFLGFSVYYLVGNTIDKIKQYRDQPKTGLTNQNTSNSSANPQIPRTS